MGKQSKKPTLKINPPKPAPQAGCDNMSASTKPEPPTSSEGNVESLLRNIDVELQSLPKNERLQSLFHSLKTELLSTLIKSVHRVENRLPSPAKSYAAAAAAANIPSVATEKPVPIKELREIQISRRNLSHDEANAPATAILTAIRNRFDQLALGHVLSIRELPSRDLVVVTDTPETKSRAITRTKEWLSVVGAQASVRPKRYTVMAHGIPVEAFDNEQQEQGLAQIHQHNPYAITRGARVLRFHWRQRTLKLHKSYSSLLLDVESAKGANVFINEGIVYNGEVKEVELFDPSCLITRCYRCQKYGHNAKFCQAAGRCSLCSSPNHDRSLCPHASSPADHSCANCTGRHAAGSADCPEQQTQAQKAREAVASKARYFKELPVPANYNSPFQFTPANAASTSNHSTALSKKRRMTSGPDGSSSLKFTANASTPTSSGEGSAKTPPATETVGEPANDKKKDDAAPAVDMTAPRNEDDTEMTTESNKSI